MNNIGIGVFKKIGCFEDNELLELIEVDTIPQAILTNRLFKQLKFREKKSAIINISSLVSNSANIPNTSCLSGTKAFNELFSDLSILETDGKIDILSVHPGIVETAALKRLNGPKTIFNITPNACAQGSL